MTAREALRRLALIAGVVFLLDQATKLLVRLVVEPVPPIEVTGFFNLVLAYNRGVSFSLFTTDHGVGPYLFAALSLVIVALLVWWVRRDPRPLHAVAAGMIVGGALGNVLDRLYLGAVVDFLDFHLGGYHWPAFNVADSGVVLGAAALLLDGLFGRPRKGK